MDRIMERVRFLLHTYPNDAVSIIVEVHIPSSLPGIRPRVGRAEVFRAWPIGKHQYLYKDSLVWAEMAINKAGRVVHLPRQQEAPNVTLTSEMRWHDPPSGAPWGKWKAKVLEQLERDAAGRVGRGPEKDVPATLVGNPQSARSSRKMWNLVQRRNVLLGKYRTMCGPYGTRERPLQHGRPTRSAQKRWREQDALRRQIDDLSRQLHKLGHGDGASTDWESLEREAMRMYR